MNRRALKITTIALLLGLLLVTSGLAQGLSQSQGSESGWFQLSGASLALFGAGIAVALAGIGSAIGIGTTANMGIGVMHEQPDLFPQTIILSVLPGTQGIYGFAIAFLILLRSGFWGGQASSITLNQGWYYFFAGIPIAFTGLLSAIHQGKVCAAGVGLTVKDKAHMVKGMVLGALVEFYAILGFLASILIILRVQ